MSVSPKVVLYNYTELLFLIYILVKLYFIDYKNLGILYVNFFCSIKNINYL